MDKAYVPLLVLMTSAAMYLWARYRWRLRREQAVRALWQTSEFIGCWVVVYLLNLLFGAVVILLVRWVANFFISLYTLGSVMLALFTLLQALWIYHLWLERRRS